MLDPQLLRSDIDTVTRRLAARSFVFDVAAFQAIEGERKTVQSRTQELQAARNQFSKRIGQAKAKGEDVSGLMAEANWKRSRRSCRISCSASRIFRTNRCLSAGPRKTMSKSGAPARRKSSDLRSKITLIWARD